MINQLVLMWISVHVCVHWCVLHLHVAGPDSTLLTLWFGDKSVLWRPFWFAGRWVGQIDPTTLLRGVTLLAVRSSCQRVNERRLFGARRAVAKWPGRMTTLCSDPYVFLRPSVKHKPPRPRTPSPLRVKLKLRFVQLPHKLEMQQCSSQSMQTNNMLFHFN